jgi:hypothetical protein
MECCDRLLEEEFKDFRGEWPNWSKQVLSMYAGELALRLTVSGSFSTPNMESIASEGQAWPRLAVLTGVRANAMIEACSLPQLTLASACRLA